ncbi:hypothetical protein FisN_18Lh241 [Fistulifera solaris]|uniref:HSF-type DNA-binding domain-containing protein n=1 Tax=Fistulifera solaris TaxID=1519565 RepID=A0A1Z5JU87_FISSO|nr:hypothetical protein FisN_18Lh241 [Fistulifera solaris]|eukprot:GAX17587.1 hypothetical protein FisN_18Lh241 [Fistulifera solaris]
MNALVTTNKSNEGTSPLISNRLVITKTFPQKLMEVVDDPSTDHAIWWLPEGESFVIRPKNFNETLDNCFQGSKLFSFTRKLYRYGFRKIITSQECAVEDLVFSHPCFQKGKPQILHYVTGSNRHTNPAMEAAKSLAVKSPSTSKVEQPNRMEKRQMAVNVASARPPMQVTPTFTALPGVSTIPNFPMNRFTPQQQLLTTSNHHPALVSAMMLRNPAEISMRAALLAREQAHQQRLQQACLLNLPQQQQVGLRLGGRPGMNNNQSQLLDLLIRKRLSELQGSPSPYMPLP